MHVHLKPIEIAIAHTKADTSILLRIGTCSECRKAVHTLAEWMVVAEHPDPLVGAEIEMGRLRLAKLLSSGSWRTPPIPA